MIERYDGTAPTARQWSGVWSTSKQHLHLQDAREPWRDMPTAHVNSRLFGLNQQQATPTRLGPFFDAYDVLFKILHRVITSALHCSEEQH